jgi:prepilin-type N-terminal cleavage/methylation domain-containing protein
MLLPPRYSIYPPAYGFFSGSRYAAVRHEAGFTLIELILVVGIMAVLMILVLPAVNGLKNARNITDAAYSIKDLLELARNHALVNTTYTWVGFFEENDATSSTNPATAGTGRLVVSCVASRDGTSVYQQPIVNPVALIDATKLVQVTKLTRFDNIHLRTFTNGTGSGTDTFAGRPAIPGTTPDNAKIGDSSPPASLRPFQYPVGSTSTSAQYTFTRIIQFSPRGECRINNDNFSIRALAEVGIQPVHGTVADDNKRCAIQVNGFGGQVKVYQ